MTTTNIQPGELMIGNYLMFHPSGRARVKPRPVKVIQINEKTCLVKDFGLTIELFYDSVSTKPIALTEQWLLEFGFEKRDESYFMLKFMIEKGISQYFNHGFSFRITIDRDNSCHVANVKYVHTLQNLFYLLTATPLSREKGKGEV